METTITAETLGALSSALVACGTAAAERIAWRSNVDFTNTFLGRDVTYAPRSNGKRVRGIARSGMARYADDGSISPERALRRRVRALLGSGHVAWNVTRCDALILNGMTNAHAIAEALLADVRANG